MRILDLCCCEGIGADGYADGYAEVFPDAEIVGVDIDPQPLYAYAFVQMDVLEALATFDLSTFDLVHASPPCQAHTTMSNRHRGAGGKADSHTDYIAAVRWALTMAGIPYVIENVAGARAHLIDPVTLTGGMFGLGVERPRLFEATFRVPVPPRHKVPNPIGVYGARADGRRLFTRADGSMQRAASSLEQGRAAMGVGPRPITWRGLAESIPPAYTAHIGQAFAAHLAAVAA